MTGSGDRTGHDGGIESVRAEISERIEMIGRMEENSIAVSHDRLQRWHDKLIDDEESEQTPQQEWEAHNESFRYEPPEKPADAWTSEEYQELHDRAISRRTQWICSECTGRGPFSSLRKARRHVKSQHSPDLVQQYETSRDELEPETDGGQDKAQITSQAEENHGLGDFSGGDSE